MLTHTPAGPGFIPLLPTGRWDTVQQPQLVTHVPAPRTRRLRLRPRLDLAGLDALHRAIAQRDNEAAERRQEAYDQALALLKRHLSEEQKVTLASSRHFDVLSSEGNMWRIMCYGQSGNVALLYPDGSNQAIYCAHPFGHVPDPSAWLTQARILVTDEAAFLRVANCHGGIPMPCEDEESVPTMIQRFMATGPA
jgi:hypothetical protein